jgi:CRISPR/Cas system-associated exonuclease Cas4 (RecB family)
LRGRVLSPNIEDHSQGSALAEIVNEFSWSKSRDGTFLECPRQYWFQYYGSWGGWEIGADRRTREIYILKQLQTRYMWLGKRVHTAIERSLRNLRASEKPLAVDVDEIIRITIEEMRSDYKSSRAGIYRKRPKSCGLFEHEYRLAVSDEEWKKAAETAGRCLRNFYGSELFRDIQSSSRADWLELEDFSSFDLDGVKVHVVLDFARRIGDEIIIYDWKTGGSDERDNRVQMACYAFYAHQKWDAAPEQVRPVEVNLNRGEMMQYSVTAADLERTRTYIQGSIADMRRLLRDPDRNQAVEEDFRKVNDVRTCGRCKFFRVCEPDVPFGPAGPPAGAAPSQGP